jgi:hypothetical protein
MKKTRATDAPAIRQKQTSVLRIHTDGADRGRMRRDQVSHGYTHTNLNSKRNAIPKIEGFSDNLVTIAAIDRKSVTNHPAKCCCKL